MLLFSGILQLDMMQSVQTLVMQCCCPKWTISFWKNKD